jgi:hypothetical protein
MSATANTPFYQACIIIGGVHIPCRPGAVLTAPDNWQVPPIIGNAYQWNYGVGLISPMVDVELVIRDITSEALSTAFLNYFTGRTSDVSNDTNELTSDIVFWDGRSGFTLGGAKAESFTISCSKGDDIRMAVRFVGTSISSVGTSPTLDSWTIAPVLRFKAVTLGGALANIAWAFSLSFSNNHTPNLALDGTQYPTAQNAGIPTASLDLTLQAADTPPATGTPIVITIAGSVLTRVITIENPLFGTENNRSVQAPRVMRQFSAICLGLAGRDGVGSNAPIQFS